MKGIFASAIAQASAATNVGGGFNSGPADVQQAKRVRLSDADQHWQKGQFEDKSQVPKGSLASRIDGMGTDARIARPKTAPPLLARLSGNGTSSPSAPHGKPLSARLAGGRGGLQARIAPPSLLERMKSTGSATDGDSMDVDRSSEPSLARRMRVGGQR